MSTNPDELEGSALSAFMCRDFLEALTAEGFARAEAVEIVAAWMSRPLGLDAATYNAVFQNFAESLRNG